MTYEPILNTDIDMFTKPSLDENKVIVEGTQWGSTSLQVGGVNQCCYIVSNLNWFTKSKFAATEVWFYENKMDETCEQWGNLK